MRIMWVAILSVVAFIVGTMGGLAWRGASSSIAGLRVACEIVNTARSSGILTKTQIDDTVDRVLAGIAKSRPKDDAREFGAELKAGCPTIIGPGKKA